MARVHGTLSVDRSHPSEVRILLKDQEEEQDELAGLRNTLQSMTQGTGVDAFYRTCLLTLIERVEQMARQIEAWRALQPAPNLSEIEIGPSETLADVERRAILKMLDLCGWNKKETAARLGISYGTLRTRLRQYRNAATAVACFFGCLLAGTLFAEERQVTCELPPGATKCIVQEQAWTGTIWRDKVTAEPASGEMRIEMTVPCAATRKWYRLCVEGANGKPGRKCQPFGFWCPEKK